MKVYKCPYCGYSNNVAQDSKEYRCDRCKRVIKTTEQNNSDSK